MCPSKWARALCEFDRSVFTRLRLLYEFILVYLELLLSSYDTERPEFCYLKFIGSLLSGVSIYFSSKSRPDKLGTLDLGTTVGNYSYFFILSGENILYFSS